MVELPLHPLGFLFVVRWVGLGKEKNKNTYLLVSICIFES